MATAVAMTQEQRVVLYPSLGVGHLNPMVELAELFLRHGVAVTIAIVDPPEKDKASADAVARLAAANPSITFHLLPTMDSPDLDAHPVKRNNDVLRLANPALLGFLQSLPSVAALVLDMFCVDALDVAAKLAIPAYFFFASNAGALAAFLHLPYLYPTAPSGFKDMGKTALHFPGLPPVCASDMLATVQDRESEATKTRLYQFRRMAEGKGILVNSFDWLEAKALQALKGGLCVPGRPTPQVYCVGPLVDNGKKSGGDERHACLEWLDAQPKQSVVFLCFGSRGAFSAAQLREMARGLERTGQRFLWAVRSPPVESGFYSSAQQEPDLEALLPEGFLERTRDTGMVLKNWAPQAEVLRHEAVGAFVTHCGWNSTLEAITAGLPTICWPLYAEQRVNKVLMVEEMKVSVVMEGYDEELVKAEEVETKVRLVMESQEGKKLRERLAVAQAAAAAAVEEGGSSQAAFAEFLTHLEKNKSFADENCN